MNERRNACSSAGVTGYWEALEPPLVQVAGPGSVMKGVPTLCVGVSEAAQEAGQLSVPLRPEDEIEVMGHQAIAENRGGSMRALCIRQPYAELIPSASAGQTLRGIKTAESRSISTTIVAEGDPEVRNRRSEVRRGHLTASSPAFMAAPSHPHRFRP
jgi:hypothetical protein